MVSSVTGNETAREYVDKNFPDSKMNWVLDESLTEELDKYFLLLGGSDFYPRTLVLNSDGVITFTVDGALSEEDLRLEIQKALSE